MQHKLCCVNLISSSWTTWKMNRWTRKYLIRVHGGRFLVLSNLVLVYNTLLLCFYYNSYTLHVKCWWFVRTYSKQGGSLNFGLISSYVFSTRQGECTYCGYFEHIKICMGLMTKQKVQTHQQINMRNTKVELAILVDLEMGFSFFKMCVFETWICTYTLETAPQKIKQH